MSLTCSTGTIFWKLFICIMSVTHTMSCSFIGALHSVRFHAVVCESEDLCLGAHPVPTNAPFTMLLIGQDCTNKTQSNHMLKMGQAMNYAAVLESLEALYI